jgi:redox-sensitive bicupin YhaK (pirin superfamily)
MIELRPFDSLGGADHGWLNAKHHFSFADYYDPDRMNWGALRVWNDDPHADMEIITYVRNGAITHKDNLGNAGRTEAGDVQVMSAGTGITHSEYNREGDATQIFQIWIQPASRGHAPSWGARPFPKVDRSGRLVTLASGDPADSEALSIRADARVLGATLKAGQSVDYPLGVDRRGYLVPAVGSVDIEGVRVGPRDGAAISKVETLHIRALEDAEIVLVDAA